MKNTQAIVTIDKPCAQNWDEMEKKDGFNFCEACNKCVIDFTGYTNAEIIKTLANASSEVCGRLSENQLAQLNYHLAVVPPNRNWMKYLGVLAIGVSIFGQNLNASAANFPAHTEISSELKGNPDELKPINIKKVSGRIIGADKKPLQGIKLIIPNTKYYALTDKDGRYEIKFAQGIDPKNNIIVVQSLRFAGEIPINFSMEKQRDLLAQEREKIIMGGMGYRPLKTSDKVIKS